MTASTFTILRQCINCGQMFESKKTTTKYCSHKCNQKHYKLRKKLEKKERSENLLTAQSTAQKLKPKVKALNYAFIKEKEFLSVREVAYLFNCNIKTVYRMIENNNINAVNLNDRMTRIKRTDIDLLFINSKKEKPTNLTVYNSYLMTEIVEKYKVSRNTIYNYGKKHNIRRMKHNGKTYYSKADIDNLFS